MFALSVVMYTVITLSLHSTGFLFVLKDLLIVTQVFIKYRVCVSDMQKNTGSVMCFVM